MLKSLDGKIDSKSQFQIQRKIFSTKEVLHISGVLKLVNEQKQKLLTFLLLYLANEET